MTFADWNAEETHHQPVSLPTIVSTTDLFDGELFGDELIDIYNNSVADGTHGKPPTAEMTFRFSESFLTFASHRPLPLYLIDIILPEAKDDREVDEDHPGTKMAVAAAAIDDGLGAFRPSTSFNDLSTLLPPATEGAEAKAAADATQAAETDKTNKKRGIQHNVEVPAAKRKAAAPRGARRPSPKKATATTAVVKAEPTPEVEMSTAPAPAVISSSEPKTEEDTPNPLVPEAAVSSGTANEEQLGSDSGEDASKPPTEADFKSIAQAAVSNLIMSVSTATKATEEAPAALDKTPVDTSTAHIKALTGNNWVAACSSNASTVSANSATDAKGNNRVRRQNLTADERAQQNRDRNREHARNTRLRKKAYVEELKRTLTELVAQRDAAEAEKRQTAQRELEQREVRFRVTEEFLKLKGRNEPNAARWSAILEDGFSLTVPRMEFYKLAEGEKAGSEITFKGVATAMEDTKNFTSFLQSCTGGSGAGMTMQFHCDRKNFFMDGCNAFLQWNATLPVKKEVSLTGVIRCVFSPASNKLVSAALTFDSGSLVSQIRSKNNPEHGQEDSAAQAAANEADAILDSLQMPRLNTIVPSNVVAVVPPSSASSASEGSLDKGDSCDESLGDQATDKNEDASGTGMTTRRVRRSD